MIRISIAYFQDLGAALKPLEFITAKTTVVDALSPLYAAKEQLGHLLDPSWFHTAVRTSQLPGKALAATIDEITARQDYGSEIGHWPAYALSRALTDYLGALRAELAIADAYYVTRKGGYDTSALVGTPEVLFPSDLGTKVPLAMPDIRDAARALAYELCTASGFHVLRATEAVLRAYWTVVSGGEDHPEQRNLGVYLGLMNTKGYGSQKVKSVLQQIKDLHRNPLMHPEDRLDIESAVDLFGIARSAIGAMLREIPSPTLANLTLANPGAVP